MNYRDLLIYIQNNIPTFATIFFFLFFCYVVYSVFKKTTEKDLDYYSKIPLKEDDSNVNYKKNSIKNSKNE